MLISKVSPCSFVIYKLRIRPTASTLMHQLGTGSISGTADVTNVLYPSFSLILPSLPHTTVQLFIYKQFDGLLHLNPSFNPLKILIGMPSLKKSN